MKRTRSEVADIIEAFLDGTGGAWDWDDFESTRIDDAELDLVREFCLDVPTRFPPPSSAGFCSESGQAELRHLVLELRSEQPVRTPQRHRAIEIASSAHRLYRNEISRREFLRALRPSDYDNPWLEELVDRIEHEPKRSGFLGLSPVKHEEWIRETNAQASRVLESARRST